MKEAKNFFDEISDKYALKSQKTNSLHMNRLKEAVKLVDLRGKYILDIGAGSGLLYDYISAENIECNYWGVDFSEKMLAKSKIPQSQKAIVDITTWPKFKHKFDVIFCLGLTTYLSKEANERLYLYLDNITLERASIIVSYTNEDSLENKARDIFKFIPFIPKNTSLGRRLNIYKVAPSELDIYPFKIKRMVGIQSILPFPKLPFSQPRPSFLHSDFLVLGQKK